MDRDTFISTVYCVVEKHYPHRRPSHTAQRLRSATE